VPCKSIYSRDLFRDQIVILTGGGSGIGRCTAHELSSLGAHVAIVGRNEVNIYRSQPSTMNRHRQLSVRPG
jgi:NADP-dependent 3-hydroxy acid dehydrogenase YdfG